jgi:hypothetical protein
MTLRNAPLSGQDGGSCRTDLGSEKPKYFCEGGWTKKFTNTALICPSGNQIDPAQQFTPSARRG